VQVTSTCLLFKFFSIVKLCCYFDFVFYYTFLAAADVGIVNLLNIKLIRTRSGSCEAMFEGQSKSFEP